jgi:hypothetical protein
MEFANGVWMTSHLWNGKESKCSKPPTRYRCNSHVMVNHLQQTWLLSMFSCALPWWCWISEQGFRNSSGHCFEVFSRRKFLGLFLMIRINKLWGSEPPAKSPDEDLKRKETNWYKLKMLTTTIGKSQHFGEAFSPPKKRQNVEKMLVG